MVVEDSSDMTFSHLESKLTNISKRLSTKSNVAVPTTKPKISLTKKYDTLSSYKKVEKSEPMRSFKFKTRSVEEPRPHVEEPRPHVEEPRPHVEEPRPQNVESHNTWQLWHDVPDGTYPVTPSKKSWWQKLKFGNK